MIPSVIGKNVYINTPSLIARTWVGSVGPLAKEEIYCVAVLKQMLDLRHKSKKRHEGQFVIS